MVGLLDPRLASLEDPQSLVNLVLRASLATVTLSSGLGKLADMPGTRQAVGDFGLPLRWVRAASIALPILELGLAGALLVDGMSAIAGWALALLMLVFAGALLNLVRQKKRPPCHCFGALHSAPVGIATVLRALVLMILAAASALTPVFPLASRPWETLAGALVVTAGVCLAIHRKRGLGADVARLVAGQRLPAVRLTSGQWLQDIIPAHGPSLLVLLSHQCEACKALEAHLASWTHSVPPSLTLLALYLDDGENLPSASLRQFSLLRSSTPGALLLDEAGYLLHPPVAGGEQIEALIRVTLRSEYLER